MWVIEKQRTGRRDAQFKPPPNQGPNVFTSEGCPIRVRQCAPRAKKRQASRHRRSHRVSDELQVEDDLATDNSGYGGYSDSDADMHDKIDSSDYSTGIMSDAYVGDTATRADDYSDNPSLPSRSRLLKKRARRACITSDSETDASKPFVRRRMGSVSKSLTNDEELVTEDHVEADVIEAEAVIITNASDADENDSDYHNSLALESHPPRTLTCFIIQVLISELMHNLDRHEYVRLRCAVDPCISEKCHYDHSSTHNAMQDASSEVVVQVADSEPAVNIGLL